MEHRWGKRLPLSLAVKLHLSSGGVAPGRIVNASLSGALVQTDARVPGLSRVYVELDAADWQDDWQEMRTRLVCAYAVREAPDLVGLEWTEFSPPALTALLSRAADRLPGNAKLQADQNGGRPTSSLRSGLFERRPSS